MLRQLLPGLCLGLSHLLEGQGASLRVSLEQGGITHSGKAVTLARAPFELVFESRPYEIDTRRWYALQVGSSLGKRRTSWLREGPLGLDNPIFGTGGTGFAANGMYEELMPDYDGHHYITWEEKGEQRALLRERLPGGRIRLAWPISHVLVKDKRLALAENAPGKIYLMVLYDENLNDSVDPGEYEVIKVRFR